MLKAHLRLEGIEHGLDDEAFAQHDLVSHGHQVVPHVRRIPVMRCRPRCQSLRNSSRPMSPLSAYSLPARWRVIASRTVLSAVLPGVIFSAMIWPLWLITKCSVRP